MLAIHMSQRERVVAGVVVSEEPRPTRARAPPGAISLLWSYFLLFAQERFNDIRGLAATLFRGSASVDKICTDYSWSTLDGL